MPAPTKAVQWYPPEDNRHIAIKRVKRRRNGTFFLKVKGKAVDLVPGDWILHKADIKYRYPVEVKAR